MGFGKNLRRIFRGEWKKKEKLQVQPNIVEECCCLDSQYSLLDLGVVAETAFVKETDENKTGERKTSDVVTSVLIHENSLKSNDEGTCGNTTTNNDAPDCDFRSMTVEETLSGIKTIVPAEAKVSVVPEYSAILTDSNTKEITKLKSEKDDVTLERDCLKSELLKLQDLFQKTNEENKKLSVRLGDYKSRISELELELNNVRSSFSIVTNNRGTQTEICEEITVETQTNDSLPQQQAAMSEPVVDPITLALDDALSLPVPVLKIDQTPTSSESRKMTSKVPIVEDVLDDSSSEPQQVTPTSISIDLRTATPDYPKNDPAVFAYSDFRYRGKELQGYVVIPKATQDNEVKGSASIPSLEDSFPIAAALPEIVPRESFRIRNEVVHTELQFTNKLNNIKAVHFGRIIGKGGQNVTDLRAKFGVKITVDPPKSCSDLITVTIASGNAIDRRKAAEEILGEIPVEVEVHFQFGPLSQAKMRQAYLSFPYVRMNHIGEGEYVLSGKLKQCQEVFEYFKSRH